MKYNSSLNSEQFREAMRSWSSGVTVVTATYDGERHGMTVSSFTSVALSPPLIMVSIQSDSRTAELISQADAFAVTILSDEQQKISDLFAGRISGAVDRWADVQTETLITGAPFIKGGLAYLDCRISQNILVGSNTIFLGEVVAVRGNGGGAPLIYHNRDYQKIVE